MHEECEHVCLCPLEGSIDVISKKWTFLIVNALGNNGRLRFKGLMEELKGISPKTLSDTLKNLQAEGLINRESFAEIPPRVEYTLTTDGLELRKSIIPLIQWARMKDKNQEICNSTCEEVSAHRVIDSYQK